MAEFRTRRRVLAGKIESVVGTPETLAAADANCLIYDVKAQPTIEMFERRPNDNSFSPRAAIPGIMMGEMTGKLEVKGSGVAGTPPAIGKYLKACAMTETINAGVSVVYTPSSALAPPSLTMGLYMDGIRRRIAGARGTFRLSGKIGEILFLELSFKGLLLDDDDIATLTGTGLETTIPPKLLGVSTFQVHSFSPKISSFAIDLGNQLTGRPDIAQASGYAGFLVTDRNPKGTMDPEDELVATHPWFTRWKNGTTGALNVQIGSAGNRVTIGAPALQYINQGDGERENLATRPLDFALVRSASAGDDELSITFD